MELPNRQSENGYAMYRHEMIRFKEYPMFLHYSTQDIEQINTRIAALIEML